MDFPGQGILDPSDISTFVVAGKKHPVSGKGADLMFPCSLLSRFILESGNLAVLSGSV